MSPKTGAQLADATVGSTDFDDDELARLNAALDESEAQYQRGEYIDAEVVLDRLRSTTPRG